jgi:hypothetical protein
MGSLLVSVTELPAGKFAATTALFIGAKTAIFPGLDHDGFFEASLLAVDSWGLAAINSATVALDTWRAVNNKKDKICITIILTIGKSLWKATQYMLALCGMYRDDAIRLMALLLSLFIEKIIT